MYRSGLVLALAATAFAAPTPDSAAEQVPIPPHDQEFSVLFSTVINGETTWMSANAVFNDTGYPSTVSEIVLVGRGTEAYPGTPAYLNGTSPTAALVFDLTNSTNDIFGLYGAEAANLGDAYGATAPVYGIKGVQDNNWGVNNGSIYHKLYSAAEGFFACQDQVNGALEWVLKFGVYNETAIPTGCEPSSIEQNFNVPGGATGPTA